MGTNSNLVVAMLVICAIQTNGMNMLGTNAERIRCTTYTAKEGKVTASGEKVHEGVIAGKPEWIGQTCTLYDDEMNLIGEFTFEDTGATKGLKNGTVVDVYRNSKEGCDEWTNDYGDYVYLERKEQ